MQCMSNADDVKYSVHPLRCEKTRKKTLGKKRGKNTRGKTRKNLILSQKRGKNVEKTWFSMKSGRNFEVSMWILPNFWQTFWLQTFIKNFLWYLLWGEIETAKTYFALISWVFVQFNSYRVVYLVPPKTRILMHKTKRLRGKKRTV